MSEETFQRRVARAGVTVVATASILAKLPFAKLLGLEVDCWRRTLGMGLRSEGSKFGLSAFGLKFESSGEDFEISLARRLAAFLADEVEARWVLRHYRHHVARFPQPHPDLVLSRFQGDALESVVLFPHPKNPKSPEALSEEATLIEAHRAVRGFSSAVRPNEMLRLVKSAGARRLMSAAFLSVEPMPANPRARFVPPDFSARREFGLGFLNFIARRAPDGETIDLWLNVHHTASDGAPMQEMLGRLEQAWGTEPVVFPGDEPKHVPFLASCQAPATDRPISLLVDFVDFGPLLARRAEVNAKLRAESGQAASVGALFLWYLTQQPEFAERSISTTVDVPADDQWPRAVDLVAIRPADYHSRSSGLKEFVHDYLQLVEKARVRQSASYAAMRAGALAPPALASAMLKLDPARTRATFGTVGLTILKQAKVFSAPMADMSFEDGFIAIGGLGLPTANGGAVTAVTIKGDANQIQKYPAAIRGAIRASASS